jgi:5-formaminoimidazole-4-carboxamide-1-beta-D-ribofuranosyl 5'-monophosphate synthetase
LIIFPLDTEAAGAGKGNKRVRFHASLTASESSTIAEEVVVLLRKLHSLPAWNPLINQFISSSLQNIPSIIVPSGSHREAMPLDAGEIQVQVRISGERSGFRVQSDDFDKPVSRCGVLMGCGAELECECRVSLVTPLFCFP